MEFQGIFFIGTSAIRAFFFLRKAGSSGTAWKLGRGGGPGGPPDLAPKPGGKGGGGGPGGPPFPPISSGGNGGGGGGGSADDPPLVFPNKFGGKGGGGGGPPIAFEEREEPGGNCDPITIWRRWVSSGDGKLHSVRGGKGSDLFKI